MTKDIIVTMTGLQMSAEQDVDSVDTAFTGTYHYEQEKHYIEYREEDETTMIVVGKNHVEVIRKGVINTTMIFERARRTTCTYDTPMGALQMGIVVRSMIIEEQEDLILVKMTYALDMDRVNVAVNTIEIKVESEKGRQGK